MTYAVVPNPDVEATFLKMGKKDSSRFEQLVKKLRELAENPEIGKPLRRPMQGLRRLHIGHYVLTYKMDKKKCRLLLWTILTMMMFIEKEFFSLPIR